MESGTGFREFLPASGLTLVLRLSPSGSRAVLLGPATEKATLELDLGAEYVAVHFRTGQAPRLTNASPSELTDAHAEITRVGDLRVDSLTDRLLAIPDLATRQLVIEDLLREMAPLVRDERCRQAAFLLETRGGRLGVDELAARLGLHVRSLERRFVEHLGLPPKRLSRLIRLRDVLGRLQRGGYGTLAELAHSCGYADQSHLNRDFKQLTGRAPGEKDAFSARRLTGAPETRIVHRYSGSPSAVAFVQSSAAAGR